VLSLSFDDNLGLVQRVQGFYADRAKPVADGPSGIGRIIVRADTVSLSMFNEQGRKTKEGIGRAEPSHHDNRQAMMCELVNHRWCPERLAVVQIEFWQIQFSCSHFGVVS